MTIIVLVGYYSVPEESGDSLAVEQVDWNVSETWIHHRGCYVHGYWICHG
ncbi:MAG TPA: hypothetical protein PKH07_19595 [bacterium]|nr:hypothetical protein [bacterium]